MCWEQFASLNIVPGVVCIPLMMCCVIICNFYTSQHMQMLEVRRSTVQLAAMVYWFTLANQCC